MRRPKTNKRMKDKMIKALIASYGIVTPAAAAVGISRVLFYEWYNEDPAFKEEVDAINEVALDFVEGQLFKKIKDGSERSIMFYMRYKARKRGYTDSVDITSDGKSITEIKLIQVKRKDETNEDE